MAEGQVFDASVDSHTVHALDATSDERNWNFTAAGPSVEKYLATEPLDEVADPDAVERETLGPWYGEYFLSMRNPEEAMEAYQGKKGARLWVISGDDGKTLSAAYDLDSAPVFDGMIATEGRLYIATEDGHVLCMGER